MRSKVISKLIVLMTACLFFAAGLVPVKAEEKPYECTAEVAVSCALGGEVEITSLSAENPAPSVTKLQLKDKETKSFSVTFNEPGNYEYQVKQIVPSSKGKITYDDAVRNVTFYVTSEGDELEPITVVMANGKKMDSLTFNNKDKSKGTSILGNVQTDDPGLQWMRVFMVALGMVLFVLAFRITSGELIVEKDDDY